MMGMQMLSKLIAGFFLIWMTLGAKGWAEVKIIFPDADAKALRDAQAAADIWSAYLDTDVDIHVRIAWIERGPTGFAYHNAVRNQPHLPVKDVWYPSALANVLAGARQSDEDDINIFLSKKANWYFQSEDRIRPDQTDFLNVMVHEIAHGLGISSATFLPWDGGPASIGYPNDYVNYFDYSFPLHEQDGTPLLYDSLLRLEDGRTLFEFPSPSNELAAILRDARISFSGPHATAANRGQTVFVSRGAVAHIPQLTLSTTPIMLPNSGGGESIHQPDAILLGMLEDLGWPIVERCKIRAS